MNDESEIPDEDNYNSEYTENEMPVVEIRRIEEQKRNKVMHMHICTSISLIK